MIQRKAINRPSRRLNIYGMNFDPALLAAVATLGMLVILLCMLLLAIVPTVNAQTQTVLYNFTGGSDGGSPQSRLTFDGAGNFYGTATQGGQPNFDFPLGAGVVFQLSPNGIGGWNESVLHAFSGGLNLGPGGAIPNGSVIFDKAGNIYGATAMGGTDFYYCSYGSIFQLSPGQATWTENLLYSISCNFYINGIMPMNGVIMDGAGNLYGTTTANGPVPGTVFEMTFSNHGWNYQTIYSSGTDNPTGITMDAAGNIYGATSSTVFKLAPNGVGGWNSAVIHRFTGPPNDGMNAMGTPVLDRSGNLYGTTYAGGTTNNGTVYRLTPGNNGVWSEKILYSFAGGHDGANPVAGVTLDRNGNLYGTTSLGNYQRGNVFEVKAIRINFGGVTGSNCVSQGSGGVCYFYVPLWNFKGADGASPWGAPILDNACNLYGTTTSGGTSGKGVVYKVSVPFNFCLP